MMSAGRRSRSRQSQRQRCGLSHPLRRVTRYVRTPLRFGTTEPHVAFKVQMAARDLSDLPGTPDHQELLRAVASHYAGDPRVRAVVVYGSLARGNWDVCSDADLADVVDDAVQVGSAWVAEEVAQLCEARSLRPEVV